MIQHILLVARGGGGGSSGGGGGGGIILIPLIIVSVVVSWWIRKKRIMRAEAAQRRAVITDSTWSDETIENRVTEVFYAFQQDWSEFNIEKMKSYMTARYHDHVTVMLAALKQMYRRNQMSSVGLKSVTLFGVHDHQNDELDRFNVEIKASADDSLIDELSGEELKSDATSFEEIWHFEREDGVWMLDSITQVDRNGLVVKYDPEIDKKYLDFAEHNNFFYNADFGWLLMPMQGVLFSQADYGRSDINHHVIGLYHGIVVQFFEYVPLIQEKATINEQLKYWYRSGKSLSKYTIAHATLPKDYSNIIVEHKEFPTFFNFTPSGMTKVTLEWAQFNKRFSVYATDVDKVTSLELLHPSFMEQLANTSFKLNIEIVGNDLYLYTTDKKADYQQMLDILKEAFKEMRM